MPQEYGSNLEKQQRARENQDGVVICTMHSSKGLEFPIVFIPEANEGITPYQKAVMKEEIEEERRLFYVAMTRAINNLFVVVHPTSYEDTWAHKGFWFLLLCFLIYLHSLISHINHFSSEGYSFLL